MPVEMRVAWGCGWIGLENSLVIRTARGFALRGTACAVMAFSERLVKYSCVMAKLLNAEYTLLFEHMLYHARIRRKLMIVLDMITESTNRPKIRLQVITA